MKPPRPWSVLLYMRGAIMVLLAGAFACTPLRRDDEPLDVPNRVPSETREITLLPPVVLDTDPDCLPSGAELRSPFAPHHEDLRLELRLMGDAVIESGQRVRVQASVHNDSSTTRHAFVLPGDGSEVGWREPTVSFSVLAQSADGCWWPPPQTAHLRCGVYDPDWTQDVVVLGPGEERIIEELWGDHMLYFDEPGRVQLRMHVLWNAGRTAKGEPVRSSRSTPMAGVPAFELTSNMVEVTVLRRFTLELLPKSRVEGAPASPALHDLLDVRLTNTTDSPQVLVRPHAEALRFELRGSVTSTPRGTWEPSSRRSKLQLAPGTSTSLLGSASPNPDLEFHVDHPVPEVVQVRATFHPDPDRPEIRVMSDWIALDLQ